MKSSILILFINVAICSTLASASLSDKILSLFFKEDPKINYLLFTRENRKEACDLQPTSQSLKKCKFNPKLKTKVLIHGWTAHLSPQDLKFILKDKILEAGNFNVVVHNWTAHVQKGSDLGYLISSARAVLIGLRMSAWIRYLQKQTGVNPKSFHLIGHSLGAEVSSFAGKTTRHLGRITFLDPAAPLFRILPNFLKPSYKDAIFVEAIHTNAARKISQGVGFLRSVGDIDFYLNGGNKQPKCHYGATFLNVNGDTKTVNSSSSESSCNHYSVYNYYLESFNKNCTFLGVICDSYANFRSGKCQSNTVCEMGFYSKRIPGLPVHSKCYIQTSKHPPYCLN